MELIKVEKNSYDVIANNAVVGWLTKRHSKGSGRGYRQYVGYVAPYDEWVWCPEDMEQGSVYYPTFKEAKEALVKLFVK